VVVGERDRCRRVRARLCGWRRRALLTSSTFDAAVYRLLPGDLHPSRSCGSCQRRPRRSRLDPGRPAWRGVARAPSPNGGRARKRRRNRHARLPRRSRRPLHEAIVHRAPRSAGQRSPILGVSLDALDRFARTAGDSSTRPTTSPDTSLAPSPIRDAASTDPTHLAEHWPRLRRWLSTLDTDPSPPRLTTKSCPTSENPCPPAPDQGRPRRSHRRGARSDAGLMPQPRRHERCADRDRRRGQRPTARASVSVDRITWVAPTLRHLPSSPRLRQKGIAPARRSRGATMCSSSALTDRSRKSPSRTTALFRAARDERRRRLRTSSCAATAHPSPSCIHRHSVRGLMFRTLARLFVDLTDLTGGQPRRPEGAPGAAEPPRRGVGGRGIRTHVAIGDPAKPFLGSRGSSTRSGSRPVRCAARPHLGPPVPTYTEGRRRSLSRSYGTT
jgi:hypothetical protein